MAFCMKCGSAYKEGQRFCIKCGAALPIQPLSQPQQPVRQTPQQQPVYQQTPVRQPVYQQPIQPVVQPQPAVQSAAGETKAQKNGLCSAGFVLSLLGIFLLGITSLFGLLFSVFGLISAGKKGQDGKGKAVAGIVMSVIMLAIMLIVFVFLRNPLMDKYEQLTGRTFPTRKVTVEYDEMITNSGWVVAEDETCIEFNMKDHTFRNYISYLDTSDMYLSGQYKMYNGKDALKYLKKNAEDLGLSKSELDSLLDDEEGHFETNLMALSCVYEEFVYQDESQSDFDKVTENFYGFYVLFNKGEQVFDAIEMHNLESGASFTLIKEDQFDDYRFAEDAEPEDLESEDAEEE